MLFIEILVVDDFDNVNFFLLSLLLFPMSLKYKTELAALFVSERTLGKKNVLCLDDKLITAYGNVKAMKQAGIRILRRLTLLRMFCC